ncbi:MAG: carbon starvation induced protein CsiD, partial [Anaerobacillus sp.]
MCAMELSSVNQNERSVKKGKGYEIKPSADHDRLYVVELEQEVISRFFEEVSEISSQQLEYIPYMRFILTEKLSHLLDENFQKSVRAILHDRNTGGFT